MSRKSLAKLVNAGQPDEMGHDHSLTDVARTVLSLIDLTSLGEDDSEADVDALCKAASTSFGSVAAICVWSRFVGRASRNIGDLDVGIAGVSNFPRGENDPSRAITDAQEIVNNGGTEVDVVYPWRTLRDEGVPPNSNLVRQVRDAIPSAVVLKVILETGELEEPELIRLAAVDSISAGADFLKTSTGKTARSATPDAVRLLCELSADAARPIGVKVSGGVRTVEDAAHYLDIAESVFGSNWIQPANFRIGASSLLDDVLSALERTSGRTER
jgi:deoxyribose-phosphate aldolase